MIQLSMISSKNFFSHLYCRNLLEKILVYPNLEKVEILCFLGTIFMLFELKDIPGFDKVQFYVLGLNDELKKLPQLHIMADEKEILE